MFAPCPRSTAVPLEWQGLYGERLSTPVQGSISRSDSNSVPNPDHIDGRGTLS
jgi:hypothetical protein